MITFKIGSFISSIYFCNSTNITCCIICINFNKSIKILIISKYIISYSMTNFNCSISIFNNSRLSFTKKNYWKCFYITSIILSKSAIIRMTIILNLFTFMNTDFKSTLNRKCFMKFKITNSFTSSSSLINRVPTNSISNFINISPKNITFFVLYFSYITFRYL